MRVNLFLQYFGRAVQYGILKTKKRTLRLEESLIGFVITVLKKIKRGIKRLIYPEERLIRTEPAMLQNLSNKINVIGDSHSIFWCGLEVSSGFKNKRSLNNGIDVISFNKYFNIYHLGPAFAYSLAGVDDRTEQNRTEQNRTEQNRTEQNRTEQNRSS